MSHACMEELVRIRHLINIVARVPKVYRAFVVKSWSIRVQRNRVKMAARVPSRYHSSMDFSSFLLSNLNFIYYSTPFRVHRHGAHEH